MLHKRLICLSFIILLAITLAPHAGAQETYRWQVNYQHVVLDVDSTGSVYMMYEVDANIVKGVWNEVWIPMTTPNMQVYDVVDDGGRTHTFTTDGSQIMTQEWNLNPGDHVYLRINSTLPGFVYRADTEGYDIVTFIPPWWDMYIKDTQVKYYLPGNVSRDQVLTGSKLYDNIGVEENSTWVYFENKNLAPNEQFPTSVSFPDTYMATGAVGDKATELSFPPAMGGGVSLFDDLCSSCACPGIFVLFFVIIFLGGIIGSVTRSPYSSPVVSMDGVSVNKSLDPVEAATLLRVDPKRVLTMIMFEMMKNGNVKLISTDPIRLELVSRKDLNYHEKLFADAIVDDRLSEDKLLGCFKMLARRVVDKTRPYCRKDTEDYYRKRIDEAWQEIKAVDTPELKLEKYDTNMFWLMADEQFATKTKDYVADTPGSRTVYVPSYYWWYPYYWGVPHNYGGGQVGTTPPTTGEAKVPQQGGAPQAPTNQTTASVESFANSISNSVEATSAGVVGGVEKFLGVRNEANAPPPVTAFTPASSHRPGRTGGGSSCACVSCACACAGGGGGCT